MGQVIVKYKEACIGRDFLSSSTFESMPALKFQDGVAVVPFSGFCISEKTGCQNTFSAFAKRCCKKTAMSIVLKVNILLGYVEAQFDSFWRNVVR